MIVFDALEKINPGSPTAVTVGKFDGFHRGHMALLSRVRDAEAQGLASCVVITGTPGGRPGERNLLTREEQLGMLREAGIRYVVLPGADPSFFSMTAEAFLRDVLIARLDMKALAVGTGFRFGRDRAGDCAFLAMRKAGYGYRLDEVPETLDGGRPVSSTRIRTAVSEGRMAEAARLLGRPYTVTGTAGRSRFAGQALRIPALEIRIPEGKLVPASGIYRTEAVRGAQRFRGTAFVDAGTSSIGAAAASIDAGAASVDAGTLSIGGGAGSEGAEEGRTVRDNTGSGHAPVLELCLADAPGCEGFYGETFSVRFTEDLRPGGFSACGRRFFVNSGPGGQKNG